MNPIQIPIHVALRNNRRQTYWQRNICIYCDSHSYFKDT